MPDLDWSKCPIVESVPGKVSGAWVLKGLSREALIEPPSISPNAGSIRYRGGDSVIRHSDWQGVWDARFSRLLGPGFGWLAQYIFDRSGKFPAIVSSMIATIYLQAHSTPGNIGSDVPARASALASRASFRFFKSEKEALYVDAVSAKKRYRFNYLKTRWRTANDFAGRCTKV